MVAGLQMIGKMIQDSSAVSSNNNAILAFRPNERYRICRTLDKVHWVPDTQHIEWICAALDMPANGVPELASQVFVE